MVFEQVKFSLEAAKSAQSNASIGIYDASAGTLFIDFALISKACYQLW